MNIAILTCGILPIPAVQGGAVENLIDFYLDYNEQKKLHDITIYSPLDHRVFSSPAINSTNNHYHFIDTISLRARIARKLRSYLHRNEYYNYFIEYYFEKVYADLKHRQFDYIILENCPGFAYKLSLRGYNNIILHLHNDLLNVESRYHDVIFKNLTKIITVSNYIKNRVSSIQPSGKICTIYNGINIEAFASNKRSQINRKSVGFSESDFVIVYSGRMNKEKGISELIDAITLLKDAQHIKLLVLGSSFFDNADNDDEFLQSLKTKAHIIKDKIVFTGFIPYKQIPEYLHIADIAVLPSMWEEPFGLTIVEAMAAGLPLITTRSGGIPELCENIASIVDRDNIINNLASSILDLYNHPEKCKKMSLASIEHSKFFDKETYCKNFFAAIDNI